jgi:hypothetical protein
MLTVRRERRWSSAGETPARELTLDAKPPERPGGRNGRARFDPWFAPPGCNRSGGGSCRYANRLWVLMKRLLFTAPTRLESHSARCRGFRRTGCRPRSETPPQAQHATLAALYVLGELASLWGLGPVTDIAIKGCQAFFGDHIMESAMPLFYPDSDVCAFTPPKNKSKNIVTRVDPAPPPSAYR